MAGWSEAELRGIDQAQELQIAPVPRNGELRAPTTIWAVVPIKAFTCERSTGPGAGGIGLRAAAFRPASERPESRQT